ncbi:SDR family NAD(P)-dependent oxidoreductase [Pedobacter sp. AW1-32]|uniref:SDR family NAD(P)-dependent oxidoreductase n=1 Tax=Pedobacter sp. AW1-32 TaxID=3383026 RepID=UPI003FF085E6
MENQTKAATKQKPIALVTGANQGIGYQVTKELIANGYVVFMGVRNLQKGEKAAAEIGPDAIAIELDVTKQGTVSTAMAQIEKEYGILDLLVNNAGVSHGGSPDRSMEDMLADGKALTATLNEVRTVWETNVFGVIAVTQAALPLLRKAQAARIVNVSSSLGSLTLNADPKSWARESFGVVYAASKTAMNAITLALSIELEKENIKVNAVSPGFTATALNNFQGTDSLEVGAREPVRVALETDGPTGTFTGPEGIVPW